MKSVNAAALQRKTRTMWCWTALSMTINCRKFSVVSLCLSCKDLQASADHLKRRACGSMFCCTCQYAIQGVTDRTSCTIKVVQRHSACITIIVRLTAITDSSWSMPLLVVLPLSAHPCQQYKPVAFVSLVSCWGSKTMKDKAQTITQVSGYF